MTLTHAALAPSGHPIWIDMARRSARAALALEERGLAMRDILTPAALHNAMVVHAAFGGSTNLILHLPAVAHAAGLPRPTRADWERVNRQVPRLVDALPNGPQFFATVQVFLAGGSARGDVAPAAGRPVGDLRADGQRGNPGCHAGLVGAVRAPGCGCAPALTACDGIDPDEVVMDPDRARARGLTSTVTFPTGNLAPEGSVIKSTAIDPSVVDADGVYRKVGPARVFTTESAAIAAVKSQGA